MNGAALYFDSSALVKLAVAEPESNALRDFLASEDRPRFSSLIARTEVIRSVAPHGNAAIAAGRTILTSLQLVAITGELLDLAATLEPGTLRSLDAIHLASALTLGDELEAVVTYDRRLQGAAESLGIRVEAPGQQP